MSKLPPNTSKKSATLLCSWQKREPGLRDGSFGRIGLGGLKEFRDQYTSLKQQKKSLGWWEDKNSEVDLQ